MPKQQCWVASCLPAKVQGSLSFLGVPGLQEPMLWHTQKLFPPPYLDTLYKSLFALTLLFFCLSSVCPLLAYVSHPCPLETWEFRVQLVNCGGRQAVSKDKNAAALILCHWQPIYHFMLLISMVTHFRILILKAFLNAPIKCAMPMQCYSYYQTVCAILFSRIEIPEKIAQMYLSLSAFLFKYINTYLLSIKQQPVLTARGVQPIYCQSQHQWVSQLSHLASLL